MQVRTLKAKTRWLTPGPQPNGLQASAEGLWVLDQSDNRVYLLDFETGEAKLILETASVHGSGITHDGTNLWLGSTYSCEILKIDPATGRTIESHSTPGSGVVPWAKNPNQPPTGSHGLEWRDGMLWISTPPSGTIYEVDPTSWTVRRSFPALGYRPHGLAWEGDDLWSVETNYSMFFRFDINTGELLEKIVVDGPEPHGMTRHNGVFWYCDAETRAVATIEP